MLEQQVENATITLSQSWSRLGEYDFSPYAAGGEQVNENMREAISEFRANLMSLVKYGVKIKGL